MTVRLGLLLIFALQNYGAKVDCLMPHIPMATDILPGDVLRLVREAEGRGDFEGTIHLLNQLTHNYEAAFGPENPATISLLNLLFRAHLNAQKYDEALPLGWKSYELQAKIHGEADLDTIATLSELGNTYAIKQKFEKAQELLKRAYGLIKAQLGQNHKDTIDILFNLAQVHQMLHKDIDLPKKSNLDSNSNLDIALRYYNKVYDLRSKDPDMGEAHPQTLRALKHIGGVLFQQNKMAEAAAIFQKFLDQLAQGQGSNLEGWKGDDPSTEEVTKHLLYALFSSGQTQEAQKLILDKNLNEKYLLSNDNEILLTLVVLKAEALAVKGKHAQALIILRESYDLENRKPQLSRVVIHILDKLISYCEILGDVEETHKWGRVILDLVEKQRVLVTTEDDGINLACLQLFSLELAIQVHPVEKEEEEKIYGYFRTAELAFYPFEHSVPLFEKLLRVVRRVADFKAKIGNMDHALLMYQYMAQNPHHKALASVGAANMAKILQLNGGCKHLEGGKFECHYESKYSFF